MATRDDSADQTVLLAIGINRRQVIVRLAGVASGAALAPALAHAQPAPTAPPGLSPKGSRDPADPDLLNPQALWDKSLSKDERQTVAAICDLIIPADEHSPAASALAVHDFIDEWVSAPYPRQQDDRVTIRGGLAWINTEAGKRHGRRFVDLVEKEQTLICDDIAWKETARPEHRPGARFFERMRHLTLLGFYTTVEGMKDLGYVGNVATPVWKGPPDAVLKRLGLL